MTRFAVTSETRRDSHGSGNGWTHEELTHAAEIRHTERLGNGVDIGRSRVKRRRPRGQHPQHTKPPRSGAPQARRSGRPAAWEVRQRVA